MSNFDKVVSLEVQNYIYNRLINHDVLLNLKGHENLPEYHRVIVDKLSSKITKFSYGGF